jgi:hypothetical protein
MKIFVMLLNAVPDVMELFIGKVREGRQDNQISSALYVFVLYDGSHMYLS